MIANVKQRKSDWQENFVAMLPEIQRRLRLAFCRLAPEAREDSIAEGVVHCLLTYVRMVEQDRAKSATPSTLAWYAAKHVRRGRPAVGRMNGREPMSRYAQVGHNIQVQQLHAYSKKRDEWIDLLVADKRATVPDQVAAKMDFGAWFATMSRGMNQIARDLARGFTTSEVAARHGITAGRISQLRRVLEASWAKFQNEPAPSTA